MADTLALTTATGLRPWNATALDLFQGPTDYADFRFTLADGTKRTVLRVMANNDIRLYGEVIMDVGAFRSPSTFSFTSSDSDAIASFRTGTGIGAEIFGLTADGQLSITPASNENAVIYLDATASTAGRVFSIRSIAATGVLEFGQAASTNSEVRWGADGAGMDQRWYGDTASAYLLWDQSADALTFGGVAHAVYQTISAPTGTAIPVTHSGSFPITQNGAETNTLADPTFIGQWLSIFVDTDTSGARVITAASRINLAGKTVITLLNAGNFIKLEAITVGGALKWQVVANDGAALT